MAMNDENCPPREEEDVNLSMSSVKAGAAVFGNLIFGSEYPDHSLCYSPSPMVNRRNNEKAVQPVDGKVLTFDKKSAASPKTNKPKQKPLRKMVGAPKIEARGGLRQKVPTSKVVPHRKNPRSGGNPRKRAGYKQQDMSTVLAGASVNPTINGVRRSKEESLKEKMMSVAELRDQRRLEREEVAAFNVKAEQTRREVIELRKKLSERFRQAKVDREQRQREERLAKVENEIQFKSQVHVEHKRTLKEQEDTRRRMSTDTRAKLRQNHREGKERMRLVSIQEDQSLFEERHESSVAMRNTKSDNAEKRRDSFAFRNGDASRIRELFAQREAERVHEEHESHELKWAGERDAEDYKKQMAQERRDSLAFRNADGKRIRDLEGQMKAGEHHDEHESYELKWDGERDAEDYKKQMAQERRDSLAFRNADGKRIRDLEGQMKAGEHHDEHESYELKWDGERDAEDYKKQMDKERRDSLAYRNAEGQRIRDVEGLMKTDEYQNEHESYELKWAGERDAEDYKKQMDKERRDSLAYRNAEGQRVRHLESQQKSDARKDEHESYELKWAGERDTNNYKKQMDNERRESLNFRNQEAARRDAVMRELLNLTQEREHESYMLKWAGENDGKKYLADQAELCRQSLAFRNAEGKRHRDIDEEMRAKIILENAQNEELNAACQSDIQHYQEECAARDRASLCLRGKEHFANKMQAESDGQVQLHEDHESHVLDTEAWHDVNDYVQECNRRKRLSLVFRAKEKRRHFQIERDQAEVKIQQQHSDTYYRSEDARSAELAKLKEKARVALALWSFGANPFATLLE